MYRLKKTNLLACILYSLQVALSIILVVFMFKLNVLPDWVVFLCILVLSLFVLLNGFFLIKKGKQLKFLCVFLAGILSILKVFPVKILTKVDYMLKNLQGDITRVNFTSVQRIVDALGGIMYTTTVIQCPGRNCV